MARLALALAYVVAVGFPPSFAVVPCWPLALPLSGVVGGLVLSAAAVASLATRTALLPWALAAVAAGWLGGGLVFVGRRRRTSSTLAAAARPPVRPAALATVAVTSAPLLAGSLAAPSAWDARMIWLLHGSWYWSGGGAARSAMANPVLGFTHSDYPPLGSAAVAGLWSVLGGDDYQLGQAVLSVLGWSAGVLGAMLVVSAVERRAQLPVAALGAVFVVALFGLAGGFGTRAYADVLWAAMAIAGALAALVLTPTAHHAHLAALCCLAAMLTKGEGLVTVGALILPLAAVRWWRCAGRNALPWIGYLVLAAAAAASWPLLAAVWAVDPQRDVDLGGMVSLLTGDETKVARFRPAFDSLWTYSRSTTALALVVGVAGALVLRGHRRALRLGSGLWLPVVAAGCFAAFLLVLSAGNLELDFWLRTAAYRTMTVVRGLLLAEVLVIGAVAVDLLRGGRRPARSTDHVERT